jgi:hypothetical protein
MSLMLMMLMMHHHFMGICMMMGEGIPSMGMMGGPQSSGGWP